MCFANKQTSHLILRGALPYYRLRLLGARVLELKLIVPVFFASSSFFFFLNLFDHGVDLRYR